MPNLLSALVLVTATLIGTGAVLAADPSADEWIDEEAGVLPDGPEEACDPCAIHGAWRQPVRPYREEAWRRAGFGDVAAFDPCTCRTGTGAPVAFSYAYAYAWSARIAAPGE